MEKSKTTEVRELVGVTELKPCTLPVPNCPIAGSYEECLRLLPEVSKGTPSKMPAKSTLGN